MKKLIILAFAIVFLFCLSFPVQAVNIDKKSEEASNIVVGKIKQIKSFYATNKWGDNLIMSEVTLNVEKVHKGEQVSEVTFIVEGGMVGDVVLRVSSVPLFEEGEALILYLQKVNGRFKYLDSKTSDESSAKGKPASPSKPPTLSCCKTFAKWQTTSVNYYINPNISPSDMSADCAAREIELGAIGWNDVSRINLTYGGPTSSVAIGKDDGNNIFFRNDPSGSTIAVTYLWYTRKGGMFSFDMIFYDQWAFFGLAGNCSQNCSQGFFLQTIAAHEFGHAIGLDHNRCTDSLMYPYADNCDTNTLSTSDTACVQSLYGQ